MVTKEKQGYCSADPLLLDRTLNRVETRVNYLNIFHLRAILNSCRHSPDRFAQNRFEL